MLVAIGIGMALASPPVLALNYWLNSFVELQGREELEQAARRHMVLAEVRVDPQFMLSRASANAWIEDGFRKPG